MTFKHIIWPKFVTSMADSEHWYIKQCPCLLKLYDDYISNKITALLTRDINECYSIFNEYHSKCTDTCKCETAPDVRPYTCQPRSSHRFMKHEEGGLRIGEMQEYIITDAGYKFLNDHST